MVGHAINSALIADRHPGLTEGIRGLLESVFDAVVIVADEVSLLECARCLHPALAIVDLALARTDGLRWVPRLRACCPHLKLIVLSIHDEANVWQTALAAGVQGFVLKRAIATDLLPAIDAVLAGQTYVSPGASAAA